MKIYRFCCGTIITKKHLLIDEPVNNTPFEIPVPFYLIEYKNKLVLFDTGQPYSAINSKTSSDYIPNMKVDDYITNQFHKIGIETTDISYIVLSHLHSDHSGGLEAFKKTQCYIQEKEIESNKNISNQYSLDWQLLNGDYDLFDDEKITIVSTPGHSPGHQSLLLDADSDRKILLTSDAIYLNEILFKDIMPGVYFDKKQTLKTIIKIKEMQKEGTMIVTGHDPNFQIPSVKGIEFIDIKQKA